jgi:hypothetical protein
MYTDQVMDNLIRAAENRPFVQLSYRALTVTDTQILKANVGGEIDPIASKTLVTATLAVLSTMQSVTSKLLFGSSLECDRQMQFFADPVLAKDDVYTYYLAFAHDPNLFICSDTRPPESVCIKKKCGHKWYWVPEDAAGVFQQLALRTTFMRGTDPPPPIVWETSIKDIQPRYNDQGKAIPNFYVVYVDSKVPNDDGRLFVDTSDPKAADPLPIQWLEFLPLKPADQAPGVQQPVKGPARGTQVDTLYTQSQTDIARVLRGQKARFYTENYPNTGTQAPDRARLEDAVKTYNAWRKVAAVPVGAAQVGNAPDVTMARLHEPAATRWLQLQRREATATPLPLTGPSNDGERISCQFGMLVAH